MRVLGAAALAALLLGVTAPAAAHEVLHRVERGRAVALRAYFPDGAPLAYCEAEVFSPADARIPWQKGRTDRDGWVAFVPDVAGRWRVRVIDASGHGLEVGVDAAAPGAAEAPGAPAGAGGIAATVLRPVAGVALVAALFGVLFALARRRA